MTDISPDAQKTLEVLRKVAVDTLDRKRRLGHYAVVWRDGKPALIGDDAPDLASEASSEEGSSSDDLRTV